MEIIRKYSSVPDLSSDYSSVIGVKKKNKMYMADRSREVEYPEDLLFNLRSIPWRRLSIQFPPTLFVHEMPVRKERPQPVNVRFLVHPIIF